MKQAARLNLHIHPIAHLITTILNFLTLTHHGAPLSHCLSESLAAMGIGGGVVFIMLNHTALLCDGHAHQSESDG